VSPAGDSVERWSAAPGFEATDRDAERAAVRSVTTETCPGSSERDRLPAAAGSGARKGKHRSLLRIPLSRPSR